MRRAESKGNRSVRIQMLDQCGARVPKADSLEERMSFMSVADVWQAQSAWVGDEMLYAKDTYEDEDG